MRTDEPVPGQVYEHYKGARYMVVCLTQDTETKEARIVYREVNTIGSPLWDRSLLEFTGFAVNSAGRRVRRFTYVG